MGMQIGIEIVGKKYIAFLSLDRPSTERLSFTTVVDEQTKALVKLFLFKEGNKRLIRVIEVRNIPPEEAGDPDIVLIGEFDGKKTLSLRVELNDRTYALTSFDVGRYLPGRRRAWIAIPVAVPLIALGLFFTLQRQVPFSERTSRRVEVERDRPAPRDADKHMSVASTGRVLEEPRVKEATDGSERARYDNRRVNGGESGGESRSPDRAIETARSEGNGSPRAATKPEPVLEGEVRDAEITQESPSAGRGSGASGAATLREVVYFEPGSALMTEQAVETLDGLLQTLTRGAGGAISIVGHCALYSTEEGREQLSLIRAQRVHEYLRSRGVDLEESSLVQGLGGKDPVTEDPDRQHLNRRVVISLQ